MGVNIFNMGAMENKDLNALSTAYILADQKAASDRDYEREEGVIGHKYFYNWTGNPVTCRDWFKLRTGEACIVFHTVTSRPTPPTPRSLLVLLEVGLHRVQGPGVLRVFGLQGRHEDREGRGA